MVDAIASDPLLSDREAASRATAGLRGIHSTNAERVRKKYRTLRKAGQLPKSGDLGLIELRAAEIRRHHARRLAVAAEARKELARLEREAASIGLDLEGDLTALSESLDKACMSLMVVAEGPIDVAQMILEAQGIDDPEEQIQQIGRYVEELRKVDKKREILKGVLRNRFILRL